MATQGSLPQRGDPKRRPPGTGSSHPSIHASVQMRATWGHFSSHVAATLESWKQWFRLHQTLLFKVSRVWVKTFRPTFFKFLFWEGFGDVILHFFENFQGPAVPPKTTFGEHFKYTFYVVFLWILNGKPDLKSGKGWGRLRGFWGPKPLIYWPLKADIQSELAGFLRDF